MNGLVFRGDGLSQHFLGGTQQDPGGKQARDEWDDNGWDVEVWVWNGYPRNGYLKYHPIG